MGEARPSLVSVSARGNDARLGGMSSISWTSGNTIFVRGEVQHGDQRGRELGFPTANLAIDHLDVDEGVWAGWLVEADGVARAAAISIGRRETIYGRAGFLLVEAHVLDFSGNLYGSVVTVEMRHWIRHQRRFRSLQALTDQVEDDIQSCRDWVAGVEAAEAAS